MKRLAPLLLVLLSAGVFAATVLADDRRRRATRRRPRPTTTTTTTVPAVVPVGVTLAGVAIGGLAPDAAAQAVTRRFDLPVKLRFDATKIEVAPSLLGVSVPVDVGSRQGARPSQPEHGPRSAGNRGQAARPLVRREAREPVRSQARLVAVAAAEREAVRHEAGDRTHGRPGAAACAISPTTSCTAPAGRSCCGPKLTPPETDAELDRPGDRDQARVEQVDALQRHEGRAPVRGRDRPVDLSDAAREASRSSSSGGTPGGIRRTRLGRRARSLCRRARETRSAPAGWA